MPEMTAEEYFKGKDDEYVRDIFESCTDAIINSDCFGSDDVILKDMAEAELERRGYTISYSTHVTIEKDED